MLPQPRIDTTMPLDLPPVLCPVVVDVVDLKKLGCCFVAPWTRTSIATVSRKDLVPDLDIVGSLLSQAQFA
jgi:hypothetical protein